MAAARSSTRPRRGESADAVLRRLLAEQFRIVNANEPHARKGSVRGLHDIRVALRRMRTLTATFAELDGDFLGKLDKRAAKVCDRMGDARDLDVWIELFGDLEKAGGLEAMSGRERRAVLRALREARKRLAAEALDCGAFRRVKRMLGDWLSRRPPRRRAPSPPVEMPVARRMLAVQKMIQQRYRKAGAFSSKPAHDLRRSGRRLRYLSEFFGELFGREGERAGHWITKAQAALGRLHDCDNALELSKDLPGGEARAAVRRELRRRRGGHLKRFKTAWKHYANPRLQERFGRRLAAAAERN